jgi:thiol-disulfide isomerase/thioredoxin
MCAPRSAADAPVRHALIAGVAALALAAGVAAGYYQFHHRSAPVTALADAAQLPLLDLKSEPRRIAEWRGGWVLVNFWATWCPPCLEEIPLLIATQTEHGAHGLTVLGVAVDNLPNVGSFYVGLGMNYPTLLGEDDALRVMAGFGNPRGTLPYTVLLDPAGEVVASQHGAVDHARLATLLAPYLTTISRSKP